MVILIRNDTTLPPSKEPQPFIDNKVMQSLWVLDSMNHHQRTKIIIRWRRRKSHRSQWRRMNTMCHFDIMFCMLDFLSGFRCAGGPRAFLCPRHKMARGHLVFALSVLPSFRPSVIPSFRHSKVCLLNSSYILACIWMKLGTDVVPQV